MFSGVSSPLPLRKNGIQAVLRGRHIFSGPDFYSCITLLRLPEGPSVRAGREQVDDLVFTVDGGRDSSESPPQGRGHHADGHPTSTVHR